MNLSKNVLLVSLLLIGVMTRIQAQRIPILLKGTFGYNTIASNFTISDGGFIKGLGAEAFLSVIPKYKIYINPSIDHYWTNYETSVLAGRPIKNFRVNYFSMSMPIEYIITGGGGIFTKGNMGLILGIGPFVNIATSGKYNTFNNELEYNPMQFGNKVSDNRRSLDMGMVIKAGLAVNRTSFYLQYAHGFRNVVPAEGNTTNMMLQTRNFTFQIAYNLFTINK